MDPVTASLLLKGVGTLAGGLFDSASARRQAKTYGELATEGEAAIPGLEQQIEQYSIGPTMQKLKQLAAEDPISDLARTELERKQGTAVEALKSGGSKSLFALPATLQTLDTQRRKIDADQYQRELTTLGRVGQAEEALNRMKFQQKTSDLTTARQQAGKYRMGELGAEEARRGAITGMITSGLNTLGSLAEQGQARARSGGGVGVGYKADVNDPENVKAVVGNLKEQGVDPIEATNMLANFGFGPGIDVPSEEAVAGLGTLPGNQGDFPQLIGGVDPVESRGAEALMRPRLGTPSRGAYSRLSQDPSIQRMLRQLMMQGRMPIRGGYNPNMAEIEEFDLEGFAKGGMLPGEFSHKTNEMDVVDNNGDVVAKVAGGEVVLNPDQQEKVAKESSFFRSLMKLPRFK